MISHLQSKALYLLVKFPAFPERAPVRVCALLRLHRHVLSPLSQSNLGEFCRYFLARHIRFNPIRGSDLSFQLGKF